MTHYIIKEQEAGYLCRNGKFLRLLAAGKYTYPKALGYDVQIGTNERGGKNLRHSGEYPHAG